MPTIKKNTEAYLQTVLNDPKSYEFVSLEMVDTVTYADNITEMKSRNQTDIDRANTNIQSQLDYKKNIPTIFDGEDLKRSQNDLSKGLIINLALDSIEKKLADKLKGTAAYLLVYKFRAKNAMGAVVLNEQYVQVTGEPDFKVLNITDDTKKLYHTPNGFPDFDDFVKIYYK